MGWQQSYFSFSAAFSPFGWMQRYLHPYSLQRRVMLHGYPLQLCWTRRADKQLTQRTSTLFVEMQLYFSCVVKKRVLFHQQYALENVIVDTNLALAFRAVESNSCDPVEFAKNFPVKEHFGSQAALKMHPKQLLLDYVDGEWRGEFLI